jgi:putative ABC transport system permease protein
MFKILYNMKSKDLIKLSTRMFKARTGRTILTVLGMGIGIGAILFLVGLGYGLQNVLLKAITTSDSLLTLDVSSNKEKETKLNAEARGKIEGMEGVAEVVSSYDIKAQLKFQDIATDATAVVTKPTLLKLEGKKTAEGRGNFEERPESTVISSSFSKLFNLAPDEMIGKVVSFSLFLPSGDAVAEGSKEKLVKKDVGVDYEIIGIVESEEPVFYVSGQGLESYLSGLDFSRLKVKSSSSEVLDGLKNKLLENDFQVSSLSDTVNEVNKMFGIIKIILALFGAVALLVSAIGMFNTMTVALLERTKEIGIMKSIGASDADILLIFLIESTIMGFLGGLSGVILGVVSGEVVNFIVNMIAWRLGGQTMALFYFPLSFIFFVIGFSLVIGLLTGVVPARRASVIDPLDALRSK